MVNRESYVEILTAARRAVQAIPGATLTIKLHPSDHTGIAERLFGKSPDCEIVNDGDLSRMLDQCDVAIVTSSTTGVEACVRDAPLIEFNPVDIELPIDYERYGAALSVRNPSELLSAIQRAIGDPEVRRRLKEGRRRLVADVLGGANGAASHRAADAILDLCDECIR